MKRCRRDGGLLRRPATSWRRHRCRPEVLFSYACATHARLLHLTGRVHLAPASRSPPLVHVSSRCVMELTEVRINLCGDRGGRLKAFCSLTFDNTFVIRDVKLIDGNDGLFLAMPSRKLCDHCPSCK